jgi:superkiller protein 3
VRNAEKMLDALQDMEKRRAEYTQFMAQGGAALKNKRYDEAVSAYAQALKLYPDDADAKQGLSDAQKAVTSDGQAEYTRLMKLGDAAMRAQRYSDAMQAYAAALKLVPNDQAAMQGLAQAQQALAALAAVQAAYDKYMQAGAAALQLKRYNDARRAFSDALKVVPNDPAALVGLRDANYGHHMADGHAAVDAKNFAKAVREFEAALVDIPNDPAAAAALKQAKASLTAQQNQVADYNKHMAAGNAAFQQKKYADAVKEYEAALRAVPNDATATAALQQAKALLKKK